MQKKDCHIGTSEKEKTFELEISPPYLHGF